MTLDFVCPFCDKGATADSDQGAVFHTMPMCPKFEQLEPIDYMKAVNLELANRRGRGLS